MQFIQYICGVNHSTKRRCLDNKEKGAYYRFKYCCYIDNKDKVVNRDLFIVVFVTITKKAGNSTHFILHILKLLHHDITTITIQIIHSRQSQFTLITGIISATYCVRYPHAVPFQRNKTSYCVKTFKTRSHLGVGFQMP